MDLSFPLFSGRTWHAKMLGWAIVLLAITFIVIAALRVSFFAPDRLITLGVAAFVSILVCRYRITVGSSGGRISASDLFGFWGVLWLGVSGGLLLGAVSAITAAFSDKERREDAVFTAAADSISLYAAALLFYLSLGYLPYAQSSLVGADLPFTPEMAGAIALMAASQYVLSSSAKYLIRRTNGNRSVSFLLTEYFLLPLPGSLAGLFGMFAFHFTFQRFGIEFGIVLVPVALIGDFAYRIHRARLQQKTKEISDVSRIHLATVEALATAIDARDQVGIGHARRTQIYAIGIGELIGLPEAEISALRTGALLHDIGKLAVPDHILNKPGRLTPAEMEKTKIHASVGASILEKVGFDTPVVPTVKYHHECWDGSGYPERLKGNNIPLTARILSVADAYDTLRGARPYRPPVSREETCNFLLSGSGTQFDPRIVSIFLKNLSQLEARVAENGLAYPELQDEDLQAHITDSSKASAGYVEQIKQANREVFTLYELARDFGASSNLHETLALFTKRIEPLVPFDTCSVYLLEEAGDWAVASHIDGKGGPAFKGRRIRIGDGPTGETLKRRMVSLNADPKLDFPASHQEYLADYSSMVSLPLIADESLIGAVTLYSKEKRVYEEEHMRLLETISKIAADAISKSQLHLATETYALTDPMTALPNARSLQMQFEKEVARADRTSASFQLLMLDLDGFKAVNDNFGHKAGDLMLKGIGKVILGQLRDYDFLARYAGDEFVALVPDTKVRDVSELCRRIEIAVREFSLKVSDEATASVGISIGAASYPSEGVTFDEMIVAADKGMYATKSRHKSGEKTPDPETVVRKVDHSFKPIPIDVNATETESEYLVELDETHIVSTAMN